MSHVYHLQSHYALNFTQEKSRARGRDLATDDTKEDAGGWRHLGSARKES